MIRFSLLSLWVIFFPLLSHASPLLSKEGDVSYFDQLTKLYDSAQLPQEADLVGWRSGRCFYPHEPNEPKNHLLVGAIEESKERRDDLGPLFPSVIHRELKVMEMGSLTKGADYFDDLSKSDMESLAGSISFWWPLGALSMIQDPEGSFITKDNGSMEYRIKKYGDYLIEKNVYQKDTDLYKAGEIDSVCYCFKLINQKEH